MKNKEFATLAGLFLTFCCCGGAEKEILEHGSGAVLFPVQFTIGLRNEVLPFPATKRIPDFNIPEPTPKNPDAGDDPSGPDVDPENLFNQIEYIVYQAGKPDVQIKHKRYTPQDPDFTIVYDSLPAGNYHLCFLAHSDKSLSVSGQTASFGKVSDTFHLFLTQEIKTGEKVVQDVTLQRVVSKIEFVATDAVPKNLKSFAMHIAGYQNRIDLTTGLGISTDTPYTRTDTFKDSDIGKTKFSHSFYTFIPATGSTLSATLTATSRIDDITRERIIDDIQPVRNQIVRYTGVLYTPRESDDTFTLDVLNGGKWGDTIDNKLED